MEGVIAIAYRLTDDHIDPKGSLKMRNALAEEVLNTDMLNNMKVNGYKALKQNFAITRYTYHSHYELQQFSCRKRESKCTCIVRW